MTNPDHSRTAPPEWNELIAIAEYEMATAKISEPNVAITSALFDVAERIEDEPLDDARFQGISLVMCGLARALKDPETRSTLIANIESGAIDTWYTGTYSPKGLTIAEAGIRGLGTGFDTISKLSHRALTPAEQAVSDVLSREASRRRFKLKFGIDTPRDVEALFEESPTAHNVGNNAISAASRLLSASLKKIYESKVAQGILSTDILPEPSLPIDDQQNSPALAAVVSNEELSALKLDQIALRVATLRQDEFTLDLEKYIKVDEEGRLTFLRDQKIRARDLVPPGVVKVGTRSR